MSGSPVHSGVATSHSSPARTQLGPSSSASPYTAFPSTEGDTAAASSPSLASTTNSFLFSLEMEQLMHGQQPKGKGGAAEAGADVEANQPLLRLSSADATTAASLAAEVKREQRERLNILLAGAAITVFAALVVIIAANVTDRARRSTADAPVWPSITHDYLGRPRRVESSKGIVAADQYTCSHLGATILEQGGNAVDAAVATSICQGVVNPFASGIGGGFFMSVRHPNGSSEFIDAREVAPAAASRDMYDGLPRNASILGGLAISIPLELKGLELAWKKWGTLPWHALIQPSISLAANPIPVHPYFRHMMEMTFPHLKADPVMAKTFLIPTADGSWRLPEVGELCCARPELAHTLQQVASNGASWLYSGQVAAQLAADIQAVGGLITQADLESVEPVEGPLLSIQLGRYMVHTPPLPSSAAVLGLALNVLQGWASPPASTPQGWMSGNTTAEDQLHEHRMVESMKEAFALRLDLGDTEVMDAATAQAVEAALAASIDPAFASELRESLSDDHVLRMEAYGGRFSPFEQNNTGAGHIPNDNGTTHISVVDKDRMAVALTSTVNGFFGSFVISPSTGILLNNEMDDFSRPDAPNQWGLHPSEANFPAPGKRPLSSMCPSLVSEGGELRLVVGASGGPRILTATLQTIVRSLLLGWDLMDAVALPRIHHQLLPYVLTYESYTLPPYLGNMTFTFPPELVDYVQQRGNDVSPSSSYVGVSQAIYVAPGGGLLVGVSDPRKDGAPAATTR